jgi:hypothetical protein
MSTHPTGKTMYEPVDASPVKSFFVSMLTRDIKLEEAILDLLDNCVDGILRMNGHPSGKKPYAGHWAEIEFNKDSFAISDNCGGIPWSLHDYAFRMGRAKKRPKDADGIVGVYGIGMKRAIFKMGEDCLISTQNGDNGYDVEITPKWVRDEEDWDIPVKPTKKSMREDGTQIVIGKLHPGVAAVFSDDAKAFTAELERMVSTHYAFIIDKGFAVRINKDLVKARPTKLIFTKRPDPKKPDPKKPAIRPYIFRTKVDGVEVFLTIGFSRPIPSDEELAAEQEGTRYSAMGAGWTVLCNDRAVLYCNRDELTGWGEAGVPRYHNQFIAISGIVEFKSADALKLPTTTTKRGIDASSSLYLQIKNKMREGMKIYTDYTNKWKGKLAESKAHIQKGEALSLEEIKMEAKHLPFAATTRTIPRGEQFRPNLPMPKQVEPHRRHISFVKDVRDVRAVAQYLFNDENVDASTVGERCFDLTLREARK